MVTPLLHGFPPIIGDGAHTLVLGNMPSVMSLAAQQYYGNPRNAFWPIMGDIFGFAADDPYDDRTAALRANGIAVWDVLRSCRRVGSLDSAVEPDSMVPNDFGGLFDQHRNITRVLFNGAAAEQTLQPAGPRCARLALPAAAVDQPRSDDALRRQARRLAARHHRTSITIRRAPPAPILRAPTNRSVRNGVLSPSAFVLSQAEEALPLAEQSGENVVLAQALQYLGVMLVRLGNDSRARGLALLDRVRAMALEQRYNVGVVALVDVEVAKEKVRGRDLTGAISLARPAVNGFFEAGDAIWAAYGTNVLVDALLQRGKPADLEDAKVAVERLVDLPIEPGIVALSDHGHGVRFRGPYAMGRGDAVTARERAQSRVFERRVVRRHARSRKKGARGDQETGGWRWAHGRAFSICALSDSSVASSKGLPTNWIDVGIPFPSKPQGTTAAGWPVTLNTA